MRIGKVEKEILLFLYSNRVYDYQQFEIREKINYKYGISKQLKNLMDKKLIKREKLACHYGDSKGHWCYEITDKGIELLNKKIPDYNSRTKYEKRREGGYY